MRCAVMATLMAWLLVEGIQAQALPVWSEADRARLKKGELIAGASILVEDPDTLPLPEVAPEPEEPPLEPVEPEPEYDPRLLPEEYLAAYFKMEPESYLIDPQRLLSMQESLDREGFLEYHADDSEIDIRMYLFDAQQEIPSPYTLRRLVEERYRGGPLTAVVFYFLGDPSRNQLAFGGEGASDVGSLYIRRMLENAQLKAMEKSDPNAQVESFIVQLSIRLYWLEKEQAEAKAKAKAQAIVAAIGSVPSDSSGSAGALGPGKAGGGGAAGAGDGGLIAKVRPFWLYVVVGGSGLLLSCLAIVFGWLLWRRTRVYGFPVFEVPNRLEANYAAGVGAVLAFDNKQGSPSSQRDQVPDYLTRM